MGGEDRRGPSTAESVAAGLKRTTEACSGPEAEFGDHPSPEQWVVRDQCAARVSGSRADTQKCPGCCSGALLAHVEDRRRGGAVACPASRVLRSHFLAAEAVKSPLTSNSTFLH